MPCMVRFQKCLRVILDPGMRNLLVGGRSVMTGRIFVTSIVVRGEV